MARRSPRLVCQGRWCGFVAARIVAIAICGRSDLRPGGLLGIGGPVRSVVRRNRSPSRSGIPIMHRGTDALSTVVRAAAPVTGVIVVAANDPDPRSNGVDSEEVTRIRIKPEIDEQVGVSVVSIDGMSIGRHA